MIAVRIGIIAFLIVLAPMIKLIVFNFIIKISFVSDAISA